MATTPLTASPANGVGKSAFGKVSNAVDMAHKIRGIVSGIRHVATAVRFGASFL